MQPTRTHKSAYTTRVLFLRPNVFTYSLRGGLPPKKRKVPFSPLQSLSGLPAGYHGFPPTQVSQWGWTPSHKQVFSKLTSSPVSAQCLREKLTSHGLSYLPIQTCSRDSKRSMSWPFLLKRPYTSRFWALLVMQMPPGLESLRVKLNQQCSFHI